MDVVGQLDNEGIKGRVKGNVRIAEKLNQLFVSASLQKI